MERDALIAHGTSYLLQDRLMNCSDYSTAWVCRTCGSLISLGYDDAVGTSGTNSINGANGGIMNSTSSPRVGSGPGGEFCRVCRAAFLEQAERERASFALESTTSSINRLTSSNTNGVRVALPRTNVLGSTGAGGDLDVVAVPFVFRYLCAELASMGIAVSLEVK